MSQPNFTNDDAGFGNLNGCSPVGHKLTLTASGHAGSPTNAFGGHEFGFHYAAIFPRWQPSGKHFKFLCSRHH